MLSRRSNTLFCGGSRGALGGSVEPPFGSLISMKNTDLNVYFCSKVPFRESTNSRTNPPSQNPGSAPVITSFVENLLNPFIPMDVQTLNPCSRQNGKGHSILRYFICFEKNQGEQICCSDGKRKPCKFKMFRFRMMPQLPHYSLPLLCRCK